MTSNFTALILQLVTHSVTQIWLLCNSIDFWSYPNFPIEFKLEKNDCLRWFELQIYTSECVKNQVKVSSCLFYQKQPNLHKYLNKLCFIHVNYQAIAKFISLDVLKLILEWLRYFERGYVNCRWPSSLEWRRHSLLDCSIGWNECLWNCLGHYVTRQQSNR
jgi:hypothetical protein